ncbi:MAG: glutamate racemase [Gammaproteobacteria bacterium]|nr:glutamate racemase [Gammaproteobacteria bacterium]
MSAQNPIGVFDSGLGGLSVLAAIRQLLPQESLIYVADNAHAPYGEKSEQYILNRVDTVGEYFHAAGVKAMVVACNTATSAAVHELRSRYTVPIVGMEPAIKPAGQLSKSGVIGVLATERTLVGEKFSRLVAQQAPTLKFILQPCPGWVQLVESGDLDSAAAEALVRRHLEPVLAAGADTLVLGCTHYPFLRRNIAAVAGPQVQIIDPNGAVARQLQRVLQQVDGLAAGGIEGDVRYFQSGAELYSPQAMQRLYGETLYFQRLPDEFC